MRRRPATFAAIFLMACIASGALGLYAACSTSSDEPFSDCAGFCLDCACCPNGVSTLGETGSAIGALVSLRSAFGTVVRNPLDAPPSEILHIPKLALS